MVTRTAPVERWVQARLIATGAISAAHVSLAPPALCARHPDATRDEHGTETPTVSAGSGLAWAAGGIGFEIRTPSWRGP